MAVSLENNSDLAEILEVSVAECTRELRIVELESWDSLARLSITSLIQDDFGITISGTQMASVKTLGDLEGLINLASAD